MGSHLVPSRKIHLHFRWFYIAGLLLIMLAALWIWSLIREDLLNEAEHISDLAIVREDGSRTSDLPSSIIIRLSAVVVQQHLEDDENTVLLDVRPPEDYEDGHISGAISIPLGTLEARVHELNPDSEIILVCGNGQLSLRAAQRLVELGFSRVFTLDGGLEAWESADLHLCTKC